MDKYDYREAVKQDIVEYLKREDVVIRSKSNESIYDALYNELMMADSVTGNASGSYTFNTWQAEENLCHNWSLLVDALTEFGYSDITVLDKGAEWCDVIIRCYLLDQCLTEVLGTDDVDDFDWGEWDRERSRLEALRLQEINEIQ